MGDCGISPTESGSSGLRRARTRTAPRAELRPHHWTRAGSGDPIPAFSTRRGCCLGMIAAARIAAAVERTDDTSASRIADAVRRLGPLPKVQVPSRNILRLLKSDKKTRDGVVHFVLPREIGKVEVVNDVPERVVLEAMDELRQLSR